MTKSLLFFLSFIALFASGNPPENKKLKYRCGLPKSVQHSALKLWVDEMLKFDPGKGLLLDPKGCELTELTCDMREQDKLIFIEQSCALLYYDKGKPRHMQPTGEKRVIPAKIRMTADGIISVIK